jgi:DNA primase large subunit
LQQGPEISIIARAYFNKIKPQKGHSRRSGHEKGYIYLDGQLAIGDLKKAFKQRLEEKKKKPKIKFSPPPYDDIYFEGLEKLDSLAGEEIEPLKGVASFSDDLWKSKARFDPDVPR